MLFLLSFAHLAELNKKRISDIAYTKVDEDIIASENKTYVAQSDPNYRSNNTNELSEKTEKLMFISNLSGKETNNSTNAEGAEGAEEINDPRSNEKVEDDQNQADKSLNINENKQSDINCDSTWGEIEKNMNSEDFTEDSSELDFLVNMSDVEMSENGPVKGDKYEDKSKLLNYQVTLLPEKKTMSTKKKLQLEAKTETSKNESVTINRIIDLPQSEKKKSKNERRRERRKQIKEEQRQEEIKERRREKKRWRNKKMRIKRKDKMRKEKERVKKMEILRDELQICEEKNYDMFECYIEMQRECQEFQRKLWDNK